MKIEIHGRQVEVDDSFKDMSEDEQHKVVDEIAAGLMPTASQAAAAQEAQESQGPNVLPNIVGGVEGTAVRALGVPTMWGVKKVMNALGNTPTNDLPVSLENNPDAIRKWLRKETTNPFAGGRTKEEAYLKSEIAAGKPIQSRGSDIPIRKGNLGITNQLPESTFSEKTIGGLKAVPTHPLGKAFTSGYNLMDVAEHAGEGTLGNVQATASGLAALAPYAEKYLPGKAKKIAKALPFAVPAANYVIDKFTGQPVPVTEQKAAGGAIQHFQKGKLVEEGGSKVMEMLKNKMAPLYAKAEGIPSRLPRANPKTNAEIRAFAERMAPQVRGEFVRAPGETTSVAGKTLAQFEREKQLQHDIRDAYPLSKPPIYDEAAHQGKVKIGIAGDQTLTGKDVYGIAGNPLSEPSRQYGGAMYPAAHPQGWASEKGAASGVQNLVDTAAQQYGDTGVVGQYMKMGPEASNYAMHNADAIIKSIDPNKVNKLDELNAMITAKFPDFAGLHNQADVLAQAQQDPNLRKFLDYLVQTKKHTEAYNLPSGQDIRHALSEPDLRNLEIGSTGKSIMQMHPGAKITPSSAQATTTYSHDIPGTYLGGTKYPRPHELEFADSHLALQNKIKSVQEMAEELVKENPGMDTKQALDYAKKFSHQGFGGFKLSQPRQIMDQQHMDEIGKYEDYMKELVGFAPGGKVGAAKKLLEEAQAAYKAKFTPGFYHGSPDPSITAFDPTKSAKDPMYITPKATFVTRDPEFAESFLSMNNNGKIKSGSTMYPVNVNLGQHWNPSTPEGKALIAEFIEKYPKRVNLEKGLKRGDWTAIENSDFLSHLKDTGHDTFHVMEGGVPNVGVLKPENIRGKFAKFDPEEAASPDFMKAKGGLAKIKK